MYVRPVLESDIACPVAMAIARIFARSYICLSAEHVTLPSIIISSAVNRVMGLLVSAVFVSITCAGIAVPYIESGHMWG
jgi:hypothetical protein